MSLTSKSYHLISLYIFKSALDKFNIQSFGDKKLKVLHENIVDFQENIFSYFSTLLQYEIFGYNFE